MVAGASLFFIFCNVSMFDYDEIIYVLYTFEVEAALRLKYVLKDSIRSSSKIRKCSEKNLQHLSCTFIFLSESLRILAPAHFKPLALRYFNYSAFLYGFNFILSNKTTKKNVLFIGSLLIQPVHHIILSKT